VAAVRLAALLPAQAAGPYPALALLLLLQLQRLVQLVLRLLQPAVA
jgi:hypothetical protein